MQLAFACPSFCRRHLHAQVFASGICMPAGSITHHRFPSIWIPITKITSPKVWHRQSSSFYWHNNITYLHSGCTSWISMAEHAFHSQEQRANAGRWLRAIHPALAINADLTNDASRVCTDSSVTKKNYNSAFDSLKFLPNSPEVERPINLLKMENEVTPIYWSQCAFSVYGIPCCFSGCCTLWFVWSYVVLHSSKNWTGHLCSLHCPRLFPTILCLVYTVIALIVFIV